MTRILLLPPSGSKDNDKCTGGSVQGVEDLDVIDNDADADNDANSDLLPDLLPPTPPDDSDIQLQNYYSEEELGTLFLHLRLKYKIDLRIL